MALVQCFPGLLSCSDSGDVRFSGASEPMQMHRVCFCLATSLSNSLSTVCLPACLSARGSVVY